MMLVVNCFHWIGFHIVNYLLESDEVVDGMDTINTFQKENLSMFVGRNDRFRLVEKQQKANYETAIVIGESDLRNIHAERIYLISESEPKMLREDNVVQIHCPFLIGEWMPMTKRGVYYNGEMIPFASEAFAEAVYIKDFVQSLYQWLKRDQLPAMISVHSIKNGKTDVKKLENSVYIRDNRTTKEKVEKVRNHFQKYAHFYD